MANQLRDLEHRDGMLTDIMTRTCDGQAAGECQGRIQRRMEGHLGVLELANVAVVEFLIGAHLTRHLLHLLIDLGGRLLLLRVDGGGVSARGGPRVRLNQRELQKLDLQKTQASNSSQYIAQST